VLTLPASGPRLHASIDHAIEGAPANRTLPDVVDGDDLSTATRLGFDWARPDGVVLLSPAAPSFGQFRDYAERAAAFAEAMRSCGQVEPFGAPLNGPATGARRPGDGRHD
ncbi:MAG TPA: hypothetical protein VHX40_02620, partial [Acidimicrobiales bacterium]|nr:hypothetical protein [Acidimicrobiales bacterium]